jgi:phage terminase large subunit-like protein
MGKQKIDSQQLRRSRRVNPSTKGTFAARAWEYARAVEKGEILACQWARLACTRHLDDLEKSKDQSFPWIFSEEKAEIFCRFFEGLPHVKDDFQGHASRGETFKLEPWQIFIFCCVFGWLDRSDSLRRFTDVYIEVPRKNGKTPMAAGVALFCLTADGEFGAEIFAGASSKEQAGEVFQAARKMALACPDFREAFEVWVNSASIVVQSTGSTFKALKADPADGPAPHCTIADEYHEYLTNRLIEWHKNGSVSRKQPLLFRITTAGTDPASPCFEMHTEVQEVLEGKRTNERLFCIIHTVDKGVDWKSKKAVMMANPNYGVSVNPKTIEEEQFQARQSATKQVAFKTKNMNIWQNEARPWINMERWDACYDATLSIDDFASDEGIGGVDLASRSDTVSTVRMFKRELPTGKDSELEPHYYCFSRHYLNSEQVRDEKNKHFLDWAEKGFLIETEGNVTDYLRVNEDLAADSAELIIRELVFDPYHASPLVQFLQARADWNQGTECISVKQTVENFSPAMKEFEALILSRRFHHDGNPVLAWMVGNTRCKVSNYDHWYPERKDVTRKIDGTIAILLALGRLMQMDVNGYSPVEVRWVS